MAQIIGFFGGDSNVGTTMIAQSVAEILTRENMKTLFIMGSGKAGVEYMEIEGFRTFDCIRSNIISNSLAREDLRQVIFRHRNLYCMGSVDSSFNAFKFPLNTYDVLKVQLEDFDYIIIDGGCAYNLAMVISALNASDKIFLVLNQQSKTLERFKDSVSRVIGPLGVEYSVILNRYIKDISLLGKKEVEVVIGRDVDYVIPFSELGYQADIEKKSLCSHRKFEKGVMEIAEGITGDSVRSGERRLFSGSLFKRS